MYAYKQLAPVNGTDEESAVLIDGRHLPQHMASKTASETKKFISSIKPDKDHSYIQLISTGAVEWYGPNKRGDSFNETSGVYHPSEPYRKEAKEVKLDGGLKKYHDATFKANGKVYREHHSVVEDKKNKPLGEVVFAHYNEPMHRGELIVKLENAEWKDDIERISKGKPCYYSMGCLTKDDVCSVCGKRTNPNDKKNRCEHLKDHLLEYTDKGIQVHAITDHPIFYDISRVARPADKIAYSIAKVASDPHAPVVVPLFVANRSLEKRLDMQALFAKVAEEEKTITEQEKLPVEDVSEEEKKIFKKLKDKDIPKVIIILKRNHTLLPPPAFISMLTGDSMHCDDALPLIGDHLDGIFNSILQGDSLNEFLDDGSYEGEDGYDRDLEELLGPIINKYSLDDEPFRKRIIRITIRPAHKMASERGMIITPGADIMAAKLAREYARYQLAFLADHPDRRTIRQAIGLNHSNVIRL